jgi:hypothetical protein
MISWSRAARLRCRITALLSSTCLCRRSTKLQLELATLTDNATTRCGRVEEELGHILKSLADVREFLTERRTSGWVRRKKRVQWKQTYLRILLREVGSKPQLSVSCYAT